MLSHSAARFKSSVGCYENIGRKSDLCGFVNIWRSASINGADKGIMDKLIKCIDGPQHGSTEVKEFTFVMFTMYR